MHFAHAHVGIARSHTSTAQRRRSGAYKFNLPCFEPTLGRQDALCAWGMWAVRLHASTAQRRRSGAYKFNLLCFEPYIRASRCTLRMRRVGIALSHASTAQRRRSGAYKFDFCVLSLNIRASDALCACGMCALRVRTHSQRSDGAVVLISSSSVF